MKEDLIEPIQEKYHGIPKIFLLQICRGSKTDDIARRMAMGRGAELPKPVDFIPRTADTIVIYAGSEDQITWVSPSADQPVCSPIIYEFCQAVQQLEKRLISVSPSLAALNNLAANLSAGDDNSKDAVSSGMDYLQCEILHQQPDPNIRVNLESAVSGYKVHDHSGVEGPVQKSCYCRGAH